MNRQSGLALGSLLLLSSGGSVVVCAQEKAITIKGSDTMVLLAQRWAEVYMKKNPSARVQVTGGGSGVGIAALINGNTDICEASRPMKDKEKEEVKAKRTAEAVETPVAVDGLAIYINTSNPVREMSLGQLKGIYTGKTTNWKEVGGKNAKIILYGRENNSGTYAYFKEHVLANVDFHPTTQTLTGTASVVNSVAKDPNGIGYGGIAYAKGIKHVPIKKDEGNPAIEPNMQNVLSGTYPISRYLYWYTAGEPLGGIKKLVGWVLSPEGQAIVKEVGYYPLPHPQASKATAKGEVSNKRK